MLRKIFHTIVIAAVAAACTSLPDSPYEDALLNLEVRLQFPEQFANAGYGEGVEVAIEEVTTANRYIAAADESGCARFRAVKGIYRVSASLNTGEAIFNGMADRIRLTDSDMTLPLLLKYSRPGTLIIKEIYCGGCSKAPEEGTFQGDKYFIIHNNSFEVLTLDGLCFGMLDPYNSNSVNVWTDTDGSFRDYAPLCEAVWRFKGSGSDFPLEAGEDAVVVINGAVDHSLQYPLSVNLNNEEYFVCYDPILFPNVTYHPTPGDKISESRHMEVVRKTGQSNAFPLSINSPTLVLFRAPEGVDIDEYLNNDELAIVQKPGASARCMKIPWEWIIDGVEVFNGSVAANYKRLPDQTDAGFVTFSRSFLGHTLHRKLDQTATENAGYEIYQDTNNSSNDFYEREVQSLHRQ